MISSVTRLILRLRCRSGCRVPAAHRKAPAKTGTEPGADPLLTGNPHYLWGKRSQKFTAETKNEKRSNKENGKAAPKFLHGSVQVTWFSSVHKQTVLPAEEQIRKGDIQPEKNGADGDSKQPGPESADLRAV